MVIVRLNRMVEIGDQRLIPGCRYVVPDAEARNLHDGLAPDDVYSVSGWNSYNRPPSADSRRIVVYRHSAWGDQLMTTAIVKLLKDRCPKARVDVYCAAKMLPVWAHSYADHAYPTPLTFDSCCWYDSHVLLENMLEANSEPDQGNAYDSMLGYAGFDPAKVDAFYKRPQLR